MSSDSITLKVRLVDKKVFKKFQFFPKKTVKEARLFISKELDVDPEQYGLFLPPKDDQNGIWFRDDYPLDFYGLEGENDKHELVNINNNNKKGSSIGINEQQSQPLMEFVEFKKRYRPIKVAKGDNQYKTVMVDDTMNVCDAIKFITQQVPVQAAINDDQLYSMNVDEVEVLSGDMTIREQGYVGECTTGLHKTAKGEINLYVKVPFFEGWVMRKRGGGLIKGLKNWNKRWYVLKKNKLLYYKAKGVGSEMGCILMKTVQAVRPARDVTDIPTKYSKLCFEIVTPARTFVMLATNNSDLKRWIETLDFSRRMFAYETQFFGVAQKKSHSGGVIIGSGDKRGLSLVCKDGDDDSDNEGDEHEEDDEIIDVKQREKEEKEEKERVEKERKEKERQEQIRVEQERQEKERVEREKEEKRLEEERIERERKIREEEEKQEQERLEREKKIKEEQEILQKQQEEFIAKQQQLEAEKQKQLQDQIEEDRRLEELMIQMELDQEERIKIRVEQERLEQEKLELQKKLEEEEKQLQAEKERIQLEQERIAKEKQEEQERQEREEKERHERQEQERQEQARIEHERKEREEHERIERQEREEKQRQEREEEERIEREEKEEQDRIALLEAQQQVEDEDEGDLLEQFEKEEEEREREQLASKRLRSLHARLEAVEAETPELKLLLSESTLSSPENLLISWANYITSGGNSNSLNSLMNLVATANGASNSTSTSSFLSFSNSSPSLQSFGSSSSLSAALSALQLSNLTVEQQNELQYQNMLHQQQNANVLPIKNLKSVDANIELYASLLYKLEPTVFNISEYQTKVTLQEKAEYIHNTLVQLDIHTITVEQILSTDSEVHLGNLLTIYEEVGGNWQEDFQTQVVSKRTFATKYISHLLTTMSASIQSLGIQLPSDPYQLIPSLLDGRVLCFLINKVYPGTIDERVIDKSSNPATVHGVSKNLLIALNASKALGAEHQETFKTISTLSSSALHNLIWSIVETCLLHSTDPTKNRHLFHLARAETRNAFKSLEREKIMLRWFNYHLRKGTSGRSINNFTDDVEDCENYAYLFDRIAPQVSRLKEILKEEDWEKRAEIVLDMASKIGCIPLLTPRDIVESENSKLNLLFVADIMRVQHCLPAYQFRIDVEELDDQVAKSKEQGNNDSELISWIQSLSIEEVSVTNLLDDFKSGFVFLKIFEKVAPAGTVDSKRLKTNPTSVFKMVELCNYTMDICHKLKLNVAGIAGTDLVNGDLRANRAILNQIRRFLGEKLTVDSVTAHQAIALKWANSKIVNKKVKNIQSFKDQFLQDGLFFLELLSSIEKHCLIDKKNVTPGATDEDQESNARYFLTNAWSTGIPLIVLWDDVAKVRSKSIKHIIETLQWWDSMNSPNNNN